MRKYLFVSVMLMLGVLVSTVGADEVTLSSDKHATIGRWTGGGFDLWNMGISASQVYVFLNPDPGYTRHYTSIVQFDLSGIPASATAADIISATVRLYATSEGLQETINVHQMTNDWAATSGSWDQSGVTWTHADHANGVYWDTPGGDFGPVLDFFDNSAGTMIGGWYDWDVTAAVKSWVDNGANYGLMFKSVCHPDHLMGSYRGFRSRTGWPSDQRPQLVVEYIPEPATMLLLGTGVLGLAGYFRRRKMA